MKSDNIILKTNANQIITSHISQKEFIAYLKATKETALKEYKTVFCGNMQVLLTKLGLMISEAMVSPQIVNRTFLGSISFLAKKVLNQPSLFDVLVAVNINDNGNKNKHSLSPLEDVDIKTIILVYNEICDRLANKLNVKSIVKAKISLDKPSTVILKEEPYEKYEMIANTRIKLHLSKYCTEDKYLKQIMVKFDFEIQAPKTNQELDYVILTNAKRKVTSGTIVISKTKITKEITLNLLKQDLIDNEYAKIIVELRLNEIVPKEEEYVVEETRVKGKIFKRTYSVYVKKTKIVNVKNKLGNKNIAISSKLSLKDKK